MSVFAATVRTSRPRRVPLRAAGLLPVWAWVLVGYAVLAVLEIGWTAVSHPQSVCACIGNADPAMYMWSLKWWPHAIAHGLNPFVSHVVWSPTGANITRSTTIPAAALVLAPITELFGPIASYNVMAIASPALAAFTAYLLCRRLVGRELPAIAGGYLFGFGNYELTQLVAHPNLYLIFLIPLFALVAVRRAEGDMSRRAYIVVLVVLIIAQMGLGTELLATGIPIALFTLLVATALLPRERRAHMRTVILESLGAIGIAVVVTSPFLYYALVRGGVPPHAANVSDIYGLDFLNPIFPSQISWLGSNTFAALWHTFENANVAEADGYLTLPLIVAFLVWAARTSRRMLARLLLIVAGVTLLAALGSHLHVAGIQTMWLPYDLIRDMPVIDIVTPGRIVMYTTLALALGAAVWLSEGGGRRPIRWATIALAAALVFPNIPSNLWGTRPSNPPFFTTGLYRKYLTRGESLITIPYGPGDNSMLWQAETDFYFNMPEGYLGNFPPSEFDDQPMVGYLGGDQLPAATPQFVRFVNQFHVRHVVVNPAVLSPYPAYLRSLGWHEVLVGGVDLFEIPS